MKPAKSEIIEVKKEDMKVSKKALSLLLSASMVITSFVGTGAFAAEDQSTWDSNFASGAYHFHITDSGDNKTATLVQVDRDGTGTYDVAATVDSEDSPWNVNAIDQQAFYSTKATKIKSHIQNADAVTVQSQTYSDGADVSETETGGYVGLSKDSNADNYTLYAAADFGHGYSFVGWYDSNQKVSTETSYIVSGGEFYARFAKDGPVDETRCVSPDEHDGYRFNQGEKFQLQLDVDRDGQADDGNFTWSVALSSADDIVKVDDASNGIFTADHEGRAVVKVQDGDNNVTYIRVQIDPPYVPATKYLHLTISDDHQFDQNDHWIHLYRNNNNEDIGDTLKATVDVDDGSDSLPADWDVTSFDQGIVEINKGDNGQFTVTPLKAGRARIKASADGYGSDYMEIKVEDQSLSIDGYNAVSVGQALPLTADKMGIDESDITWESSDTSIATVSGDGEVTGVKPGDVTITASAEGYGSASLAVTVRAVNEPQVSYSYDGSNFYKADFQSMDIGNVGTPYETISYSDAHYDEENKALYQEGLLGSTLYVTVPVSGASYQFSSGLIRDYYSASGDYSSKDTADQTVSAVSSSNGSTTLKLSLTNPASYQQLAITAGLKTGEQVSWWFNIGNGSDQAPVFGRSGTYTYTSGSKTFTFTDGGKFTWGQGNSARQIKDGYTDSYGFTYDESVKFYQSNGKVDGIDATILSTDNPTKVWVTDPDVYDMNAGETDFLVYHDWWWDGDSSIAEFEDFYNQDDNGNNEMYVLKGNSPTPSNNGGSSSATTGSETTAPGTTTVAQSATGATTVTYVTVASAPVVSGTTSSVLTVVPIAATEAAAAAGTVTAPATLSVQLPSSTLIGQLQSPSVQSVTLTLSAPTGVVYGTAGNVIVAIPLDPTVLQAAQAAKKDVKFTFVDAATGLTAYTWSFSGAALTGTPAAVINLAMTTLTTTLVPWVSGALPSSVQGAVLAFADNGELPGPASVSVYVGDQGFVPGETAYLYYANEGADVLEATDNPPIIIDAQGDANVSVTHNSKYVLLPKQVAAATPVKLDTGKKLSVKAGQSYLFKVTSSKKPTFASGNDAVFTVAAAGSKGNDYFFRVTAVGKVGSSTGLYVNGEKKPRTVATIIK